MREVMTVGGGWSKEEKRKGREKEKKEREEREGKCKMKFKIIIFEFIVHREIVKRSKNLISCHVNSLSTIWFNKKFSFLIFKRT